MVTAEGLLSIYAAYRVVSYHREISSIKSLLRERIPMLIRRKSLCAKAN